MVLAEKLTTAISLGATSTRVRDYHDVWALTGIHDLRAADVAAALKATAAHTNSGTTWPTCLAAGMQSVVLDKATGDDPTVLQEIDHHLSPECTDEMLPLADDIINRLRSRRQLPCC
jgi:hypothetical protein